MTDSCQNNFIIRIFYKQPCHAIPAVQNNQVWVRLYFYRIELIPGPGSTYLLGWVLQEKVCISSCRESCFTSPRLGRRCNECEGMLAVSVHDRHNKRWKRDFREFSVGLMGIMKICVGSLTSQWFSWYRQHQLRALCKWVSYFFICIWK